MIGVSGFIHEKRSPCDPSEGMGDLYILNHTKVLSFRVK